MHVLVTGGAGFIGSHTVDLLLARGYRVRVLDALTRPVHQTETPLYLSPRAEFLHGDVTDRAALRRALEGVDAVLHLAAYQDYLPDFSTFFRVNAAGTALLYELIVAERLPIKRVVVASSQAVYGEGRYHCPRDGIVYPGQRPLGQLEAGDWEVRCPVCGGAIQWLPTPEDAELHPHNPYALSKQTQEAIALQLGRRYDIPSVALRYSITQGPRQSFFNAYSGILRSFTARLFQGQPPLVYEDGQQRRDYVSVYDVARATVLALEDDRAVYQAFNVGSGVPTSVLEYAWLVIRTVGVDVAPLVPGDFRVGDTRHIVSDIAKLRALGWAPVVPLPQLVAEYVDWARAAGLGRRGPGAAGPAAGLSGGGPAAAAEATMRRLGALRRATRAP